MPHRDWRVIKKIMQRIDAVQGYCQGLRFQDFSGNTMLTEACVFNLLQIGEICNQELSSAFKSKYNSIPWHQIYGLRNRIVHGYDHVNMIIVWETITDDLPILHKNLETILQQLSQE
jgi:uncharacterized protein with HEPN domain